MFRRLGGSLGALLCVTSLVMAQATLDGTAWRLVKVQGKAVDAGATIKFEGERATGNAGCNTFFAKFQLSDSKLTIGPAGATRMFCSDRAELEKSYLDALESVLAFAIEGSELRLLDGEGNALLEFTK